TNGQAEAGAFSSGFCREERIEHLFLYLGRNASTVVPNAYLYAVAKVLCRSRKSRLKSFAVVLLFTFTCRIEAVGDQVQESPCDLLRKNIDLTGGWIKGPLHIDLEALFLGARTMIGEIKTLLDEGVNVGGPMFARSFTGMQQHVLDDGVSAL